ncbi:MAG: response regulator [Candidatus Micrarchaeota archaeon]
MKSILYVEDDKDTAEAVKLLLERAGFAVDFALTGTEGLQKAGANQFDLVLLDVLLPDMKGWDVFSSLREKNYSTKFAFISIVPITKEKRSELEAAGVVDYISKPFGREELIGRISKIFEAGTNGRHL